MPTLHMGDAIAIMRPAHWIKNLLVFAPVFFAGMIGNGGKMANAAMVFGAFCLVAGGGYAINDVADKEENRRHEGKKGRPVARGRISSKQGTLLGIGAMGAGMAIAMAGVPEAVPAIGLYAILSGTYSAFAKRIPVVEMLFFPAFYLARIFAGGVATGVEISRWLILCVIFMSMFLITVKRRTDGGRNGYSDEFLSHMAAGFAAATLISYGVYCVLGAQSPYAVYSILFPIAGIMRYTALAAEGKAGAVPERTLVRDPFLAGTIAVWIIWMYALLYGN